MPRVAIWGHAIAQALRSRWVAGAILAAAHPRPALHPTALPRKSVGPSRATAQPPCPAHFFPRRPERGRVVCSGAQKASACYEHMACWPSYETSRPMHG